MSKPLVEVYARKDCLLCCMAKKSKCTLCHEARDIITRVNIEVPFQLKEVDIRASEELQRTYEEAIPTIFINGKKVFKFKVDEFEFKKKVKNEIIKAGIMKLWNKKQHYS